MLVAKQGLYKDRAGAIFQQMGGKRMAHVSKYQSRGQACDFAILHYSLPVLTLDFVRHLTLRTTLSAMTKLIDDHRTEYDIGSPGGLPPRHQAWRAPAQQANASVGVGKENHSKGRRCSKLPWSQRRNSGMEPETVSKKFFGQPFSSKSDASGTGLT